MTTEVGIITPNFVYCYAAKMDQAQNSSPIPLISGVMAVLIGLGN